MQLHYKMTSQEWKELIEYLTAQGCKLIYYPETDNDGFFVDFKYVTVEYNGVYFYMDASPWEFSVTKYMKVSPYEKWQAGYDYVPNSSDELMEYIRNQTAIRAVSGAPKHRIFLIELYTMIDKEHTALWYLRNTLAGNREKAILADLNLITMQKHTKDYCVLRFHAKNGDWFDYETKSRRITG